MKGPSGATLGIHAVNEVLAALSKLGLDTRALCRAAGITPRTLRDPNARVPSSSMSRLFAEAERRSGDVLIGLHAGERAEPHDLLTHLMMSSPRFEDGLRHVQRLSRLISDRLRIDLGSDADWAWLVVDIDAFDPDSDRHLTEYLFVSGVESMRCALGRRPRLQRVDLRHRQRGDRGEPARVFGCPVRFQQPANRLVFPRSHLDATPRVANALVARQLEEFAMRFARHPDPSASIRERVASVAREFLALGRRADRDSVARRIGVSRGTLQRRLERERITFKAVRDAVIWEAADALLSNSSLRIETIALRIGFADVAAFSRAFTRRTGCSPTRYRARLVARPTSAAGRRPA